jgi:hypothetical protein
MVADLLLETAMDAARARRGVGERHYVREPSARLDRRGGFGGLVQRARVPQSVLCICAEKDFMAC